jgi:hypothetical protein
VGLLPDAAAGAAVEAGGRSLAADATAAVAGTEGLVPAAAQEEEHVKVREVLGAGRGGACTC